MCITFGETVKQIKPCKQTFIKVFKNNKRKEYNMSSRP